MRVPPASQFSIVRAIANQWKQASETCRECSTSVRDYTIAPRSSLYSQRPPTSLCLLHACFSWRAIADARTKSESIPEGPFWREGRGERKEKGGMTANLCHNSRRPYVCVFLTPEWISGSHSARTIQFPAVAMATGLTTACVPRSPCLEHGLAL